MKAAARTKEPDMRRLELGGEVATLP
jgi:hypothetical protein